MVNSHQCLFSVAAFCRKYFSILHNLLLAVSICYLPRSFEKETNDN